MALGCYWIARRITRRLEELQKSVEQWGSSTHFAQVAVEGHDEVADLANSFNRAVQKIDTLLKQQKRVLTQVSHELRSPLARLRMAIELLGNGHELETERRHQLREDSANDIQELDELIGDLLLATRLDSFADLEEKQKESVDLYSLLSEEAQRVGAQFSGRPHKIQGNGIMLRRLLRNLLENARRYGAETKIEVSLEARGSGVRIVVVDRGPGIPKQEQERIFEPFYRLKGENEKQHPGVGLGLSLVKQIAEYHNGAVRYVDREGGGSRFEVDLP